MVTPFADQSDVRETCTISMIENQNTTSVLGLLYEVNFTNILIKNDNFFNFMI